MKKIKSDMPGDVVEIGPDQKEKAENIFSKLFAELKENIENKDKIVVSLYGGSGSGKFKFCCFACTDVWRKRYRTLCYFR